MKTKHQSHLPQVKHDASLLYELDLTSPSQVQADRSERNKKENTKFEATPFDEKIKKNSKMKLLINSIKARWKLHLNNLPLNNNLSRNSNNSDDNDEETVQDELNHHEHYEAETSSTVPKFIQVSNFYRNQLSKNISEFENENPVGYFFSSQCKKNLITSKLPESKPKENYTMSNPFGHNANRGKKEKKKIDHIKNKMAGWGQFSKWMNFNLEKVMPCRCHACEFERFEKRFDPTRVKVILLVDFDSWATDELSLDFQKLKNVGITNEDISHMYLWCFYNGYIYEKGMKKDNSKNVFDCYNFIMDNDDSSSSKEETKVKEQYRELRKQYQHTILGSFDSIGNLQMSQSNLQPQSADLAILSTLEYLCNKFSTQNNPPKICVITRDRELSNTSKCLNSSLIHTPFGTVNYVFKKAKKLI
ncbi:hypothetical protein FDP41_011452 [Naegleria fowleri]|uniref:NYN domain-containing protein n=1 Tax=Naegleria fowleri TaxID=5763 RepID=A0A6A5C6P4_NAEFO|nr:uncharacterized protein FDP41_011452 [Naegleria fowleri]KAF0982522.1 hypothetical protein FDP41_011452 [Naegleria fowleri]CAG4710986.1 unnamed protein product [Naegleria fowleri]